MTDAYFGGTIGAIARERVEPRHRLRRHRRERHPRQRRRTATACARRRTAARRGRSSASTRRGRSSRDARRSDTIPISSTSARSATSWRRTRERGVFKTTDGGRRGRRSSIANDSTGVSDLVTRPAESRRALRRVLACVPHAVDARSAAAPGSGIFKSTDGGEHWTELTRTPGLPEGHVGNIGLAVSPAKPTRVWALIEADSAGCTAPTTAARRGLGSTTSASSRQRAWYYTRIYADPHDTNVVYALNTGFYRSTRRRQDIPAPLGSPHGDNHDLWIAPNDPQRMIERQRRRRQRLHDGRPHLDAAGPPTAQFYHVETTNDFPYQVCGAQQDNSDAVRSEPARRRDPHADWEEAGGGESGYIAAQSRASGRRVRGELRRTAHAQGHAH